MKRKLFNAALFGAVLVAAPVSTFVSCADYDEDLTNLQKQVTALQELVNSKYATIEQLNQGLQTAATNLETERKKLQDQIDKCICKDEVKGIDAIWTAIADLETIRQNIQDLQTDMTTAKGNVDKLLGSVYDEEGKDNVAYLLGVVSTLDTALKTAEGKIETLEGLVGDETKGLVKDVTDLQSQVSTLQGQVSTLEGTVGDKDSGLVKDLADLSGVVNGLLETVGDATKGLVKDVKDLQDKIGELPEGYNTVAGYIADVNKKLGEEIAKCDAVRDFYATYRTQLAALVADPVTKSEVTSLLQSYVTNDKLTQILLGYVTNDKLNTTLADYVTKAGLNTTLEDYVTKNGLATTLQDYVTQNMLNTELAKKVDQEAYNKAKKEIEDAIAANKGKISANEEAILGLVTRVLDLELQMAELEGVPAAIEGLQNAVDLINNVTLVNLESKLMDEINKKANQSDFTALRDKYNTFIDGYEGKITDVINKLNQIANMEDGTAIVKQVKDINAIIGTTDDLDKGVTGTLWYEIKLIQRDYFTAPRLKEALANWANGIDVVGGQPNTDFKDAVEKYATAEDGKVKKMVQDMLDALETKIDGKLATIKGLIDGLVKSIVLQPDSYFEGIQAVEGTSFQYYTWTIASDGTATKGTTTDTYCPSVVAHYHLNPSTAGISTNVNDYVYTAYDRLNRAVSEHAMKAEVIGVAKNGGMLDVTLKLGDPSKNKTPLVAEHNSTVTMMALQYTQKGAQDETLQTITSDYHVLYLNPLVDVALLNAKDEHDIPDLVTEGQEFAEKKYVEYTKTYDIKADLAAQFGDDEVTTTLPDGFTYNFVMCPGTEIAYFNLDATTGVVTPQLPGGKPATVACVGKKADIRIEIVHDGKVVEVGYYNITITGEAVTAISESTVADDQLNVWCLEGDEEEVVLNKNLSLENVWALVAETTGEELDVVKTKYAVTTKTVSGKEVVAQYAEYNSVEDNVYFEETKGVGVITLTTDGKINWVVKNVEAAPLRDNKTKQTPALQTYVRVRSLDAISSDTYNEFYLPVVWLPKYIEQWGEYQEVSWKYTKATNQWQANESTGEQELRLYPDLTVAGMPPYEYDVVAKAFRAGTEMTTEFVGTAKDFVNVKNKHIQLEDGHFRFIEHPNTAAQTITALGKVYTLEVSVDGKELIAKDADGVKTTIATITREGKITYEHNAVSEAILNANEKNQLAYGQTVCARVGYEVKCCAGEVKVIDGDFDVRFIKPLTVLNTDIEVSDTDGVAGVIKANVLNNIVAFNGKTLASTLLETPNYFEIFAVGIDLGEVKNWKTNYDEGNFGENDTLEKKGIAGLFDKNEADGEIIYTNNTAVVSTFSVLVPVKVSYYWNEDIEPTETTIKLTIKRTLDNSNRR